VLPFLKIRPSLQRFRSWKVSTFRQIGIVAVFVFLACASIETLRAGQEQGAAKPSGPAAHGVELTILDKTCKPCEDFYHYASGEWLAKNPVPAAYPSWGRFNELAERNRELLHQILEGAAANTKMSPGSNEQKIGDFYASCMDEKQVNSAGAKPLDAEFARIDGVRSTRELQEEIARLQGMGVGALFDFGSTQDE
jgi:putative endopeptidase